MGPYREGKASIGRAAEIAGVTTIEFKDMLADRGIVREIETSEEDMERGMKAIDRLREKKGS